MLVLAVERQERTADVAKVAGRPAATVEVGAGPPLRTHAPREDEVLGVVGYPLAELLPQRVRELERALHIRLRRAGPHDPGPRLAAEQEVQRVRQHRLAGPGLAREHVEPRPEAQLGPLD